LPRAVSGTWFVVAVKRSLRSVARGNIAALAPHSAPGAHDGPKGCRYPFSTIALNIDRDHETLNRVQGRPRISLRSSGVTIGRRGRTG